MKIRILAIFYSTISCLFLLLILAEAFNALSFGPLGVRRALAASACNSNGKITLDSSKSSIDGSGTIWSNNALDQGQSAGKSTHTSLKTGSGLTSIINNVGGGTTLEQTTGEFQQTENTYKNLQNPGGLDRLTYFDNPQGQLFDFARYKAAAVATSNALTWSQFEAKVVAGDQLYGIVHVEVDASSVNNPKLDTGSINIKGSLVIDVINKTSNYKIKFEVPTNINPVTSPTTGTAILSPTDFDNWTTLAAARTSTSDTFPWPSGYDSAWNSVSTFDSGSKDPRGVALSGHTSFGQYEDMPALMYSGGIVDVHHEANISGVVYSPDFVEIEQKKKDNEVQYINGAVIGGAGIFLESNSCGGGIAVILDPLTFDNLKVNASLESMQKVSWKRKGE